MKKVFIGRQPILNIKNELIAYEVLFRDKNVNFCEVGDSFATANVIANTVYNIGIDNILEDKKGFINFTYEMLMNNKIIEILPNNRIVIELLETMQIDEKVVDRCKELKAQGYLIAIDDFIGDEDNYKSILNIVDIVKVDLMGIDNLEELTNKLKKYKVDLLAEKVETKEEFEICKKLGYKYFQGYFFAKPVVIEGKKIDANYHSLIRLLTLLESNPNINEVVKLFKEESSLSIQILYVLNHSVSALKKEITSIQQALSLLGMDNIKKWVMLLLYMQNSESNKNSCEFNPISKMALNRAKLMEILQSSKNSNQKLIDEAFMSGLLSLLDVVLSIKKDDVFKEIKVSENIRDSILGKSGPYSKLLEVVESIEVGDFEAVTKLLKELDIHSDILEMI